MTQTEALRLALEALESASYAIESWGSYASEYFQDKHDLQTDINNTQQAITAIKAALEAKDEPVAFKIYKPTPPRGAIPNVRDAELPWVYDQDPSSGNVASMWVTPVKATPPQRPSRSDIKPLTDEEKLMCWARATCDADVEHKTEHQCLMDYADEIEAAHGIKGEK